MKDDSWMKKEIEEEVDDQKQTKISVSGVIYGTFFLNNNFFFLFGLFSIIFHQRPAVCFVRLPRSLGIP